MGAPAQVSQVEFILMQRVLDHVTSASERPIVLEFRRHDASTSPGGAPEASPSLSEDNDAASTGPRATMKVLAERRSAVEAEMVKVAKDVAAVTGAQLLADKGFASVDELTKTATKKWRAEAKATAVAELQVLLGMGLMDARYLVGLATAPDETQASVVDALARGEASLTMALRFWERCGGLPDEVGAEVADALFGTDPATAAEERLDNEGNLRSRPWHVGQYAAALDREAERREGKDAEAKREQRRRARQEREVSMRVHDDGMATLTIRCPLTTGAAVYQRIDACSRSLRAAGDPRTLRQLRADFAGALLLRELLPVPGGPDDPGVDDLVTPADLAQIARILSAAPPVRLQVVVPWDVLTGRPAGSATCPAACCRAAAAGSGAQDIPQPDDDPVPRPRDDGYPHEEHPHRSQWGAPPHGRGPIAEVLGMHPAFIGPEHARVLALQPDTTLARLLVDPADGRLIERTIKTYRPDADMRRQVRAADVMSRMPGSRRPADWCDIDHEHPFSEGGPTTESNLNLKDRRPHGFKTRGWWKTAMAANRDVTWTTLLGQTETTRCHDYRQYLDQRAPLDPDQADVHPSQRTDLDARLDVACRALYAALVHRDPHAHLADRDDHHGATEHDPALGGWVWVSHTNPDGVRRRGAPPDHPTTPEILGMPADLSGCPGASAADKSDHDGRDKEARDGRVARPEAPWAGRAADDEPPPF